MVVVLVIAVLVAIAIPTFLGMRTRTQDRAVQGNVRNAHTVQMVIFSDRQRFTDDVGALRSIDSSLTYTQALAALAADDDVVYVEELPATVWPGDTVVVGARSGSGRCYWIRSVASLNTPRYADNDCSGVPPLAAFRSDW